MVKVFLKGNPDKDFSFYAIFVVLEKTIPFNFMTEESIHAYE